MMKLRTLISAMFFVTYFYMCAASTHMQSQSYKILPQLAGITAGLLLHVISELPIVYMHEAGHAIGSVITGGPFHVQVWNNWKYGIVPFLIMPFQGQANGNDTFACLIGGPIAGMMACYFTLIGVHIAKSRFLSNKSILHGLRQGLCEPLTIHASIKNRLQKGARKKGSDRSIFWKSFFISFFVLKVGRTTGEFLNGFTPLAFDVNQDGVRLWQYVQVPHIPISWAMFVALAGMPILSSVLTGCAQRWRENNAIVPPCPAQ